MGEVLLGIDFGGISDSIWRQFWSHAGTLRAKVATQTPKKGVLREVQNQDPKKLDFGISREGVRRVHSNTIAQFSLFHPGPVWLNFGVILGSIWRPKSQLYSFWVAFGDQSAVF